MANYIVPEEPEFTEQIEKLETNTPGHANVFNQIYEKIFHNTLFLKVKTAVLETEIAKAIAIALGRNQALVFNTYDEMSAWFADEANAEAVAALVNGTNLYIIDKGVPDYWWSSANQKYYELETQKVDLTKYDNIIGETDISEIGNGTITDSISELNENVTELKKSVSDGKSSIASAITDQGVTTSADATFDTMATNISTMATNQYNAGVKATKVGTATAANVLTGKTFTNSSGVGLSGTMANNGTLNWKPTTSTSKSVSAGYYSGGTLDSSAAYNAGVAAGKSAVKAQWVTVATGWSLGSDATRTDTIYASTLGGSHIIGAYAEVISASDTYDGSNHNGTDYFKTSVTNNGTYITITTKGKTSSANLYVYVVYY